MATITNLRRLESTLRTTTALALGGAQISTGHGGGIGATAEVLTEQGYITLQLTKLDGEADWTADALYKGSLPVYANGEGARYLRTKTLTDAELIAELDAAAAELSA